MAEGELDTATITYVTGADGTLFATLAVAFGTESIPRESELGGLAFVEVLEGYLYPMDKILGFANSLGTATTSTKETPAPEELAEKILIRMGMKSSVAEKSQV